MAAAGGTSGSSAGTASSLPTDTHATETRVTDTRAGLDGVCLW
jgi:hypothetical protein